MKKKYLLPLLAVLVTSCDKSLTTNDVDVGPNMSVKELNTVLKPVNQQASANQIDNQYITNLINFSNKFADKNIMHESRVFSPLSIYNCYAMLYEGTTKNVREKLNEFFDFDSLDSLKNSIKTATEMLSIDSSTTKLDTANSFWIDDDFQGYMNKDYLDTLAKYYYAEAFGGSLELDATRQDMANWVNKKTNNIFNVSKENFQTSPGSLLMLINTLYLKTPWLKNFNTNFDYDSEFYSNGGTSSKTFMTKTEVGSIYAGEDFDVASMPLQGGVSFRILLPHENTNYVDVLNNNLNYIFDLSSLSRTLYEITYKIPKFKAKSKYDLKKEFTQMGLSEPFAWTNDYENIVDLKKDDQKFRIEQSIHEAGIDVNNDGIEAAAYTSIGLSTPTSTEKPIKYPPFIFNANRSFMYALTYNNIPLFLGTLLD